MAEEPESNGIPPTSPHEELDPELRNPAAFAWMDEHMGELRQSAYGQRLLYQSLVAGSVLGLAAHVGGYLLRPSPPTEPLGLVADLLYGLGYALWTGVVVALFVQVIPEVKRRQVKATLEAYEAARKGPSRRRPASRDDEAPTAN